MLLKRIVEKTENYHICDFCRTIESYQTCDYCGKDFCDNCSPSEQDIYYFLQYDVTNDDDGNIICKNCMEKFKSEYRDDITKEIVIINAAKTKWIDLMRQFNSEYNKH